MKKKIGAILLVAIAAAMFAPVGASADHTSCHSSDCDPAPCSGTIGGQHVSHGDGTIPVRVTVPTAGPGVIIPVNDANRGPFYLDVRDLMSDYAIFSIWIYQETNNVNRLQRGGRAIMPDTPATTGDDTCEEATNHDQAIF